MKKQFLRVKQIADQTFLRAEKSDALTEDLLIAEKRVDSIKVSCQATHKKITSCQIDFGSETSLEKRLKKIPQVLLGTSMLESGSSFSKNSVLGDTLRECATVQTKLGTELFEYYTEVEKCVLRPVAGVLDNEVHNINKLRKQLGKLVLDMDSARTRFQTAERHSLQASSTNNLNAVGKVDNLKEELEDASQKVEQCRDALATEMFTLIGREPHLARLFLQHHQLQAAYHRNALAELEASLPTLENLINNFPQKPVYGCSIEEHLRVTNREIAQVIETSVLFLLEYGLLEEGLLRIAGSATKLKKLKSALDAGIELDMEEYVRDPHAVAGAFKSYLRELPEPLLTTALYNDWMNAAKQAEFEVKLQALWQVLHRLPTSNFKNLKYVVKFLAKLQENMDVNKMSSQNIAIVMAPNLIWSPTEEATTIGMNMSTASLHTSIVDLLISYADWFFPEEMDNNAVPVPQPRSSPLPNINEPPDEQIEQDSEVNGNNLDVANSVMVMPPSPNNRSFRKPAAPPPPAQRASSEHPPLIDFISASPEPPDIPLNTLRQVTNLENTSNDILRSDKPIVSNKIPQNIARQPLNTDSTCNDKNDKPIVPSKPGYSSCSLDRKSIRQSSQRLPSGRPPSDAMSRSIHVERPTVPPPERPDKVKETSSSQEDLTCVGQQESTRLPKVEAEPVPRTSGLQPSVAKREGELEAEGPTHPVTVQRSRSASKMNRFDFLVNQREERPPPERPPRSTEVVATATGGGPTEEAPVSPKSKEVEKVRPPRPQPPAKPKLNLQTENTSL